MTAHIITFLLGAATGAAATYLGNKFTDQRRRQEAVSEGDREFESVRAKMPQLIAEMKTDLEKEEQALVREFFLSKKANTLNTAGPCFVYYEDDHPGLQSKVHILNNVGYVVDITPGNAPKYRMSEEFVERVLKSK